MIALRWQGSADLGSLIQSASSADPGWWHLRVFPLSVWCQAGRIHRGGWGTGGLPASVCFWVVSQHGEFSQLQAPKAYVLSSVETITLGAFCHIPWRQLQRSAREENLDMTSK
jgi:hypothetical protein